MMNKQELFKQKIKNKLPMAFQAYMEMALFDPEYGYYTTHAQILGRDGDFVTAPELSHVFGASLATQIQFIFEDIADACILELGAGSGRLCVDILKALEKAGKLPDTYFILELSGRLQASQQALIMAQMPHLADKVKWLQSWPSSFQGVVIANEVMDAMPVMRFFWTGEQILESEIIWDEASASFKEQFIPSENSELIAKVKALHLTASPYCSEINTWAPSWLDGLWHALERGVVLLIDYGYPQKEYYHPDRYTGTLMCHQQQRAHHDFLYMPGEMDITAHVDFTEIAEVAFDLGFQVLGYTNQASFLLANGILEHLAAIKDEALYQAEAQRVKILLQSHEMGELFKVMALGKNYDLGLQGFSLHDRRVSL